MPVLKNKKHEAFAQAVALGMPASQAYVEHVSDKCAAATAETAGPALARSSQVSIRISELRKGLSERVEKKFGLTRDKWLDRLEGIAGKAEEVGDFSAATKALSEVGKASAWYEPEKHELLINVTIGGNADSESDD